MTTATLDAYRVESTGDGARVEVVFGWDNVVSLVASMLYCPLDERAIQDAIELLEEGIDSGRGWDGERVTLRFEDGAISVERAGFHE